MAGFEIGLPDIRVESLYPKEWDELSLGEFWNHLPELDPILGTRSVGAGMRGRAMRYIVEVNSSGGSASLAELSSRDPLAKVRASDSIVEFQTEEFANNPLVISGRGGGPRSTASAVWGDVFALSRSKLILGYTDKARKVS